MISLPTDPFDRLRVVYRSIPAAVDTEAVFRALFAASPTAFWLDSSNAPGPAVAGVPSPRQPSPQPPLAPEHTAVGAFSILGDASGPLAATLSHRVAAGGPAIFEKLRACLRTPVEVPEGLPCEFALGLVMALGYESRWDALGVPRPTGAPVHRSPHPDAFVVFADRAIVVDHADNRTYALALLPHVQTEGAGPERPVVDGTSPHPGPAGGAPLAGGSADGASGEAGAPRASRAHAGDVCQQQEAWLQQVEQTLRVLADPACTRPTSDPAPVPAPAASRRVPADGAPTGMTVMDGTSTGNSPQPNTGGGLQYRFDRDRATYEQLVRECQEHIRAGDSYEICLTNTATGPALPDPFGAYLRLRRVSPVPYGAYLRFADSAGASVPSGPTDGAVHILSASPERFLHASRSGVVEAKPIKGTRPRGTTPAADAAIRRELASADKDRAENVMIVDLLRNDLNRVCTTGSVHAPVVCGVESFSHVHQLVSTVRGVLAPGLSAIDCLAACFPGGSMTGAPKIRTMELIDRLEPRARGFYSGAIGWISHTGAMDLSITIRTCVTDAASSTFGVGGAVVADSDPGAEWEETQVKARALLQALGATAR